MMALSTSLRITLCLCALMYGFDVVASGNVTACTITKPPILCNKTDLWKAWNCTVSRCIAGLENNCNGDKCESSMSIINSLLGEITVAVANVITLVGTPIYIVIGVTVIINLCSVTASAINILIVAIGVGQLTAAAALLLIEGCVNWLSSIVNFLLLILFDAGIFLQVFLVIKLIFCIAIDIIVACIGL